MSEAIDPQRGNMQQQEHRLLLVQSEGPSRSELAGILLDLGYELSLCDSATHALSLYLAEHHDVILLDLHLRGADGSGLLYQLTGLDSDAPVIVICQQVVMSDALDALRYGACDYLTLPITDTTQLAHSVERAYERTRLRRENRAYRAKLENANRELLESLTHLQQDQQAGRHIQRRMLPETPKDMGAFVFSHYMHPSLYLSGDFIDYFSVGEAHAVFLVADVSGHGASSAFVTVMLKNLFARSRSDYAHGVDDRILSPSRMLDQANRELMEMDIGKHVTMCVGLLGLEDNSLLYTIAGHLPAPVIYSAGEASYLEGSDLPVGLFADASYGETSIQLANDAVLTLFTDGILEIVDDDGVIAKEARLLETLAAGDRDIEHLVERFRLRSPAAVPDDIAMLLITRE